jgi:hypothetical protein
MKVTDNKKARKLGITTLSITTLSIRTFSTRTFSITTLNTKGIHYNDK